MVQYDKMSPEEEAEYAQTDAEDYSISDLPTTNSAPKPRQQDSGPAKKSFFQFAKEKTKSNIGGIVAYAKRKKDERAAKVAAEKAAFDALPEQEKARIRAEKERLAAGRQKVLAGALKTFGVSDEEPGQSRPVQAQRNPFDSMFGGGSGGGSSGGYSIASPPMYDFGGQTQSKRPKGRVVRQQLPGPTTNPLDAMFKTPKPTRGIKPPKKGVVGDNYFANMGLGLEPVSKVRTVKGKKVKSVTFRF
jgi:hypothetical protein